MAAAQEDLIDRVRRTLNTLRARNLPENAPTYERQGSHVILVNIPGPRYDFARAVESVQINPGNRVEDSR